MNTLSITRDDTEITVLGGIGDVVRIWIGNENIDVIGTANDWSRDEVALIVQWLDAWLLGQGQTAFHLCKQQHSHRSPYEVDLCNMAYQHVEAAQAYSAASGRDERAVRQELNELKERIRAIIMAVQEVKP